MRLLRCRDEIAGLIHHCANTKDAATPHTYKISPRATPPRGAARTLRSVAAFFSPNGSLSVNDSAPAVGRNAIQNTVQSFMTAFPDLQVILDKLVAKR